MMHIQRIVATLLGCACAVPGIAGNGVWTTNGPDGGIIYEVRFDPAAPTTMYATSRAGFFRSDDGGLTWMASNDGLVDVTNAPLIVDAEAPGHLYVFDFGNRLYRSTDHGSTWTPTGYIAPADTYPWNAVDEPGTSGKFFVTLSNSTGESATPMLLKTSDGGVSFSVPGSGLADAVYYDIEFDPANPNVLLASIEYRPSALGPIIYRSLDGGATWNGVGPDASYSYELSHGAGTYPTRTVYAAIDGVLHRSLDSGATWAATAGGSMSAQQILAHPTLANTVYFADEGVSIGPQRSTDGGATATPMTSGLTSNTTYIDGAGKAVMVQAVMFNFSPGFPAPGSSLWLSTYGDGLFRSVDTGATWASSHIGLRASNIRALAVHPNPLTIGPGGSGRYIFAGFGDSFYSSPALYRSVDTGSNWSPLNTGLRASNLRAVILDPTTAGVGAAPPLPAINAATLYAAGRSSLAGFPADRYRNAGLFKSINGGLNWSVIDGGLPRTASGMTSYSDLGTVRAIALDPRSCVSPPVSGPCIAGPLRTLWAASDGARLTTIDNTSVPGTKRTTFAQVFQLAKTLDAGVNWSAVDGLATGFPVSARVTTCPSNAMNNCIGPTTTESNVIVRPTSVAPSPTNSATAYVGTYLALPPTGTLPPNPVTGMYKTTNAGANWTPINTGLPLRTASATLRHDMLALAMHPTNDQILWVTTVDFVTPNSGTIYKTIDGGANWTESGEGLRGKADIRAIAVDPSDLGGNTLYASGAGTPANPGAVYKSVDGGATWLSISVGLPADSALSIAVDPFNFSVIHAGTNNGVWSLTQVPDSDDDGVPDATENNGPNNGDGNGDAIPDASAADTGTSVVILRRGAKGVGGFFTSDIDVAASTPSEPGGCTQAVDVQGVIAAQNGRDYVNAGPHFYKYPRDLVRFEVVDCSRALVDVTFHNAAFATEYGWSFRFFGPLTPGDDDSLRWSAFNSRAQRVGNNATKWRLTLDANQFGSYRPTNDSILFLGGPACYDDRLFRSSMETAPDSGPPTCDH